ncbi:putative HAD superfamily hydrolase [Sphaerosporella brunnea]|uniref:Putative HAD superfamily hydrolase n=1 Tax=Sphaerosporella brunnea TaxID=1250544 RepID=A0A5J5F0B2_9PEZI|nr:putative HAD superfamily hydrolase [Sphaerosporella brunnea]
MAPTEQSFPPVRACLFDMDGLLLNTEDLYTKVTNTLLTQLGRPPLTWHIKAQLQGRPVSAATKIFRDWAQLPIPLEEYLARQKALQAEVFSAAGLLPGVEELIDTLLASSPASHPTEKVHIALATSSASYNFQLKTSHLQHLFKRFPKERQILGDDPRIPTGRGKPAPDIYLLALESINAGLRAEGKPEVTPAECLVFEDAVPGVEAGRRAGMRVVWVPHPGLLEEYKGREKLVLAGVMGEAEKDIEDGKAVGPGMGSTGKVGDGKGELRTTLEGFDYSRYGIITPKQLKN